MALDEQFQLACDDGWALGLTWNADITWMMTFSQRLIDTKSSVVIETLFWMES